jgi:hypothetical protein
MDMNNTKDSKTGEAKFSALQRKDETTGLYLIEGEFLEALAYYKLRLSLGFNPARIQSLSIHVDMLQGNMLDISDLGEACPNLNELSVITETAGKGCMVRFYNEGRHKRSRVAPFPNLTFLCINSNYGFGGEEALIGIGSLITGAKSLRGLYVNASFSDLLQMVPENEDLKDADEVGKALSKALPTLEYLSLSGSPSGRDTEDDMDGPTPSDFHFKAFSARAVRRRLNECYLLFMPLVLACSDCPLDFYSSKANHWLEMILDFSGWGCQTSVAKHGEWEDLCTSTPLMVVPKANVMLSRMISQQRAKKTGKATKAKFIPPVSAAAPQNALKRKLFLPSPRS